MNNSRKQSMHLSTTHLKIAAPPRCACHAGSTGRGRTGRDRITRYRVRPSGRIAGSTGTIITVAKNTSPPASITGDTGKIFTDAREWGRSADTGANTGIVKPDGNDRLFFPALSPVPGISPPAALYRQIKRTELPGSTPPPVDEIAVWQGVGSINLEAV